MDIKTFGCLQKVSSCETSQVLVCNLLFGLHHDPLSKALQKAGQVLIFYEEAKFIAKSENIPFQSYAAIVYTKNLRIRPLQDMGILKCVG